MIPVLTVLLWMDYCSSFSLEKYKVQKSPVFMRIRTFALDPLTLDSNSPHLVTAMSNCLRGLLLTCALKVSFTMFEMGIQFIHDSVINMKVFFLHFHYI